MTIEQTRPRVVCRHLANSCRSSVFGPPGGAQEVHLFVEPEHDGPFEDQLAEVIDLYHGALVTLGLSRRTAVFRRSFVSDAANQLDAVMSSPLGCGVPATERADDCLSDINPETRKHVFRHIRRTFDHRRSPVKSQKLDRQKSLPFGQ